jgi:dUTP pyrophosphatase
MQKHPVKVKRLGHFHGDLPAYQTELASGFDVRAQLSEPMVLKRGSRAMIPTGLSFEIPPGFEIQARPRSGLAAKNGISVLNTPGTIDADYRGEVKIILINLGDEDFPIKDQADFQIVDDLSDSKRGAGGFGSTGV